MEKNTININGEDYTLTFSNRAFLTGMWQLKKQGWELSWGDLLGTLQTKDLSIDTMQGEPFVFAALTFIGISGEKGQRIAFDDVLEDMKLDRMPVYSAVIAAAVSDAFDSGEPPVKLEGGGEGPVPLAESGSPNDGALPDTTLDSKPDPSRETSTTNSGT